MMKIFERYINDNELYTVDDFLNEKPVKRLFKQAYEPLIALQVDTVVGDCHIKHMLSLVFVRQEKKVGNKIVYSYGKNPKERIEKYLDEMEGRLHYIAIEKAPIF